MVDDNNISALQLHIHSVIEDAEAILFYKAYKGISHRLPCKALTVKCPKPVRFFIGNRNSRLFRHLRLCFRNGMIFVCKLCFKAQVRYIHPDRG